MAKQLYKFQSRDLGYWWNTCHGRGILGWDMGLGKTYVGSGVTEWLMRNHGVTRVLVVCPPALIKDWVEGLKSENIFATTPEKPGNVIVCSYAKLNKISTLHFDFVIADECHYIKAPTSQRSKRFRALAQASQFLLMTSGTLTNHRDTQELINYLWCINTEDIRQSIPHNITTWRRQYCTQHPYINGLFVTNPSGAALLNKHFRKYACFRKLQDEVEMPEFTQIVKKVDSGIPLKEYLESIELDEDLGVDANYEDIHLTHALMLANGMNCDTKEVVNKDKIDMILELLSNMDKHQVIVWVWWREFGKALYSAMAGKNISCGLVNGETSPADKSSILDQFKRSEIRVLIASQGSVAEGHNLQNCRYQIFANIYYDIIKYEQAKARIFRIGQKNPVMSYLLIGNGTIEEDVLDVLEKKMDLREANDYLTGVLQTKFFGAKA